MNKTWMITMLSVAGGLAALGALGVAVWNSKQMRMARTVKRAKCVLYQAGNAMRAMSGMGME
ncbi:MAG: hypothetical protein IJX28_06060 [Clostridia bacterium]|nr:hypothetical protein [Clostridia bacterium]